MSVIGILLGRGLQLVLWDAPFREVLWNEELMKPLIEGVFNIPWKDYVTDLQIDAAIQNGIKTIGFMLILGALAAIWVFRNKSVWASYYVLFCGFLLGILIFLEFKEKFYQSAQFLEGTLQIFTPVLFVVFLRNWLKEKYTINLLKLAVALTFVGHGLYALNLYPTPGNFVDMVIVLLGVDETSAHIFLQIIGWIDVILLLAIFFKETEKPALIYATIWGLATAFARYFYVVKLNNYDFAAYDILYRTLFRLAHGLIPLALFIYLKNRTHEEHTNHRFGMDMH